MPRERRRLPDYESQRASLSKRLELELDLVAEAILADPHGMAQRLPGRDGSIVDVSAYDAHGLPVAFRFNDDGVEFVALAVRENPRL